jgi:molybdopterin-guanine dinucleotide biosynthesis protein A
LLNSFNDIEAFILAGGASSRMGRDKWRLRLGETTFIERAATALQSLTTEPITIVGNSSFAESFRGFRFLPDDVNPGNNENRRGAIIGLQTVFRNSGAKWAAILACDLPFASVDLMRHLAVLRTNECESVVPVQPDGRWQPLCALYHREACLPHIEEMIKENIWSVKELLCRTRTRLVEFAEIADLPGAESFFLNVNTPADYERALRIENDQNHG